MCVICCCNGKGRWGTSGLAYRRLALKQILPIPGNPVLRIFDSYSFYGHVGCINEPLMFYRMHGNNRRAHSDNLPYLIEQREDTAACINKAALASD